MVDLIDWSAPGATAPAGPIAPPSPLPPSSRHVFVDEEGRRAGWVAMAGWLLCLLALSYVVLLGAALVGAPWVPHGTLPLAGPVRASGSPSPIAAAPPPAVAPGAPGGGTVSARPPSSASVTSAPALLPTTPSAKGPATTSPATAAASAPLAPAPPTTAPLSASPLSGPPATRPSATTTPDSTPGKSGSHGPTTTAKPGRR